MDHETANGPGYRWLEELQVAEVLAALTGLFAVLFCFLGA